jgi:hypothetical protein
MTRPSPLPESPMTVQLNLAPETERVLRDNASRTGRTLEALLEEMADREARSIDAAPDAGPQDQDGFERGLDELSEGLTSHPTLPDDFSRADIYGEHA